MSARLDRMRANLAELEALDEPSYDEQVAMNDLIKQIAWEDQQAAAAAREAAEQEAERKRQAKEDAGAFKQLQERRNERRSRERASMELRAQAEALVRRAEEIEAGGPLFPESVYAPMSAAAVDARAREHLRPRDKPTLADAIHTVGQHAAAVGLDPSELPAAEHTKLLAAAGAKPVQGWRWLVGK